MLGVTVIDFANPTNPSNLTTSPSFAAKWPLLSTNIPLMLAPGVGVASPILV